jgi:sulfite reductase (ferredoxin)
MADPIAGTDLTEGWFQVAALADIDAAHIDAADIDVADIDVADIDVADIDTSDRGAGAQGTDRHLLQVDSWRLLVLKRDGRWLVMENRCPHRGGPIGAGTIVDQLIQCPWHGLRFEIATGRCIESDDCLTTFETRTDASHLWARLAEKGKLAAKGKLAEPTSDAPQDAVTLWTVRYGRPGHVGRFVDLDGRTFRRGEAVWIASHRGQELGEVLTTAQNAADGSRPSSVVLRPASAEEINQATVSADVGEDWLRRCVESTESLGVEVTILDAERLADGQTIVVYFVGEASAKLGPLAVKLSDRDGQVRFEPWAANATAADEMKLAEEALVDPDETREERWKRQSDALRAGLADALQGTSPLDRRASWLLEFHGVYRQRKTATSQTTMMLRLRSSGGRFRLPQIRRVLEIAARYSGSLRLTARQGMQLHGMPLESVLQIQTELQEAWLGTFAACGDTVRSIVACPMSAPRNSSRGKSQQIARELGTLLLPSTNAHAELFHQSSRSASAAEPILGPSYLPHKLKVGVGIRAENCVDVFAHDLGLVLADDGVSVDLFVGGRRPEEVADDDSIDDIGGRLAWSLGRVPTARALESVCAIVEWYRDHGNRTDRKQARLRHAVQATGLDALTAVLRDRLARDWMATDSCHLGNAVDHLGWSRSAAEDWALGLPILAGRLDGTVWPAFLADVAGVNGGISARVTPQQDLLLVGIRDIDRKKIEALLHEHPITQADEQSRWRRLAMTCPSLPTCSLGVGESERALPGWLEQIEAAVGRNSSGLQIAVAGCPNSCSRTWLAEIGLVATSSTEYEVWVGGTPNRNRMAERLITCIDQGEVVSRLLALYNHYSSRSQPGESFGDYCRRVGVAVLRSSIHDQ